MPAGERRDGVVLAQNYGEAGALALMGPPRGLPTPLSGHLSWQYWHPAQMPERYALTVGYQKPQLRQLCLTWRIDGRIRNTFSLDNEEEGLPIATCHLRKPLGTLWQSQIVRSTL
jgi:hypothetical protein